MPYYNIAANQRLARPFQAAREGKALRAATRYQELINEGLQRKIDLAPELEARARRTAQDEEEAAERQATMDKLQGVNEILRDIETEDDWERSREALTEFGDQDPGEYSKEMVGAFRRYTGDMLDIVNGMEYFNAIGEPDKAKILEARALAQAGALQAEQDANEALTEYRRAQAGKSRAETDALRSGGTKNQGALTLFVNPSDPNDRVTARLNTPEAQAAIERGMEERTSRQDEGPIDFEPPNKQEMETAQAVLSKDAQLKKLSGNDQTIAVQALASEIRQLQVTGLSYDEAVSIAVKRLKAKIRTEPGFLGSKSVLDLEAHEDSNVFRGLDGKTYRANPDGSFTVEK
ncbi:MAG: hypothetical protein IH859_05180 [Chloroflexi bacterium]|nr:hypothetical protein [Chloroflexota bacterium]